MANLCAHGMNPISCPTCYHSKMKEQQMRPKGSAVDPILVGGVPVPRAGVIPFAQAAQSPQAIAIAQRKAAALAKLPAPVPVAVAPNPHAQPKVKAPAPVAIEDNGDGGSVNGVFTDEQLLELASEYEDRNSIIDSHERHPEANTKPGSPIR